MLATVVYLARSYSGLALTFIHTHVVRIVLTTAADEKIRATRIEHLLSSTYLPEHPDSLDPFSTWGDEVESQDEEILPAPELTWSTLTLLPHFPSFSRSVIMPKCAALRALGGIFVCSLA
jgi:hypothetical protein